MAINYSNYWLSRIIFKSKLDSELKPKLTKYINRIYDHDVFDEIKLTISNWLSNVKLNKIFYIDLSVTHSAEVINGRIKEVVRSVDVEIKN